MAGGTAREVMSAGFDVTSGSGTTDTCSHVEVQGDVDNSGANIDGMPSD